MENTDEIMELLKGMSLCGIKSIESQAQDMCDSLISMKRENILKAHKFKISQTSGGRWRTFLPDENGKKGKELKKSTKEDLLDAIVAFYENKGMEGMQFGEYFWDTVRIRIDSFGLSANTEAKYRTDYKRFFEGSKFIRKDIRKITDEEIHAFLTDTILSFRRKSARGGLGYKSFCRLYEYLKWTFDRAKKEHVIRKESPMQYIQKRDYRKLCYEKAGKSAATETIRPDHFKRIMEQIMLDEKKYGFRYPAAWAVHLAALTGVRVGECAALRWSDIGLYNEFETDASRKHYIHICHSDKYDRINKEWSIGPTKTNKDRYIPTDCYIEVFLEKLRCVHQASEHKDSDYLFPNGDGWTHSNIISSYIKNKCIQLGLERRYGIHALRKTVNSEFKRLNVPTPLCSDFLGNSIAVNETYYQFDRTDMDEKCQFLEQVHRNLMASVSAF